MSEVWHILGPIATVLLQKYLVIRIFWISEDGVYPRLRCMSCSRDNAG